MAHLQHQFPATYHSCARTQSLYQHYIFIYYILMTNESNTPVQLDLNVLRASAQRAVGAMKLLANEDRLLLLCQLSQGEKCVSELEELLDIRQPTLSQQLGVLRKDGVIAPRRDGKNIYYSVASPELLQILALLYQLYCPAEP